MSDLRDSLGRWAGERGEEVARVVSVHEGETRAAAGRRRARNLTLAAGAALVGLVGASALVVSQPWGSVDPAQQPASSRLQCGEELVLDQPVTFHDRAFADEGANFSAELAQTEGVIRAGSRREHWDVAVSSANQQVRWDLASVAVRDGVVMGVAIGGAGLTTSDAVPMHLAVPGECRVPFAAPDGEYDSAVVVDVKDAGTGELLATYVASERQQFTGVMEYLSREFATGDGPALLEPYGDSYQAFVLERPAPQSCTPYSDMLRSGEPTVERVQYPVTLPGVQELTGEIWVSKPAAVIDDPDYEAWYVGLPTVIMGRNVYGGNPTGVLHWVEGSAFEGQVPPGELWLVNSMESRSDTLLGDGCAFEQPIPSLSGAVFLIIDGVDWDTVSETHPNANVVFPDGAQTWVYLGQAEPTTAAPEPEAKTYDAYVVNPPDDLRTCDPIQYLRGSGYPKPNSLQYQVTIPGVIEPVGVDPVAIADESVADQWYFDKPAWLSFENPGSTHDPTVAWNPRTFTLEQVDGRHPPGRKNCPVTLEWRAPSGGMWLVIGGVDLAALNRANPGADYVITENSQTWIYLGDLEEPTP